MKTILTAIFSVAIISVSYSQITDAERKSLVNYYNEGLQNLENEIKGLSEAQLNWKPNDSTWSIAECVEHIALSESELFGWVKEVLKSPAAPDKKSAHTDEQVAAMVQSREKKVKTHESLTPKKQFGNTAQSLNEFKKRRAETLSYIETTNDNLRQHFAQTPMGDVDVYQVLLFLNAHALRHTAQIAEVKAMHGFPGQ